jgi:hypothetical protein
VPKSRSCAARWPRPPTPADPPPGPLHYPHPIENGPRPDYLRHIPPLAPRRARGGPPPLGPNPAARGMDPLAPEFVPNLVRKTARIMAGMDRVIKPGGIATPEGLSAAFRAGMQHLAAHPGDVHAAITSAKAAGAAGQGSERTTSRSGEWKSRAQQKLLHVRHSARRQVATFKLSTPGLIGHPRSEPHDNDNHPRPRHTRSL